MEYKCDDQWHKERFELFRNYCLPSFKEQTCKEFEWIIVFNDELRERYSEFIEETEQAFKNIRYIFVSPKKENIDSIRAYIRKNVHTEFLITSRVDNDDAIASHFVELVQAKFFELVDSFDQDYIINSSMGYQYETKFPFRKAVITDYKFSPFISLCSRKNELHKFRTVVDKSHLKWKGEIETVELAEEPLWTQVIHTKNRANRVLSLQLLPTISDKHFPCFKKESKNNLWVGVFLLFIQFPITFFQRVVEKARKMRR